MKTIGFTSNENAILIKILNEQIEKLENFSAIKYKTISPDLFKSIESVSKKAIKHFEDMIYKIENLTNI
jgi:hypothetical protein